MKEYIKKNKKLKAVLCSIAVVSLCLIGGLIYRINVFGDTPYYLPDECNIGGITYTKDHPLVILEIVPNLAYDELGPMIGNNQGTASWTKLTQKYSNQTTWDGSYQNTPEYRAMNAYYNLIETSIGGSGKGHIVFIDQNNKVYEHPWDINSSVWKDNGGRLSAFTPVLKDENGKVIYNDGMTYRNYFAKEVFGNYDMDDKMDLIVKKANEVTESDIDHAGLVYINRQAHVGATTGLYNTVYGTSEVNNRAWLTSNCDMDADTAMYLYRSNVVNGKALIFQSADKGDENGTYSNVSRISTLLCGIDGDTFITDFCQKETYNGYSGAQGYVTFDNNKINIYGPDNHNHTVKMDFSSDMFLNSKYGFVTGDYSTSRYPYYNASAQNFQTSYIHNTSYQFNSDNSMTMCMLEQSIELNDYDSSGNYLGTTYDDVKKKVAGAGDKKVSPAQAIKYILGVSNEDLTINRIKVLEIEPAGQYQYTVDHTQDGEDTKTRILSWFGLDEDASTSVTVDHIAMNGFIGLNSDIRSEYDLIIIGSFDDQFNTSVAGTCYNTGNDKVNSYPDADFRSDDLTDKAYNKLIDYITIGMPIIMDTEVYYSNPDVVDSDTNVYQIGMKNLKSMLIQNGQKFDNISVIPEDGKLGKRLSYRLKPDINISKCPVEYNGSNGVDDLVNSDDLGALNFSGQINDVGSSYRVRLFFDRNCDSMFSDDAESEEAELYYDHTSTESGQGLSGSGYFNITTSMSEATTGYLTWKLEITDNDTGLVSEKTGAFGIRRSGEKQTVKVLQIKKDYKWNKETTIDLNDDDFINCFNNKSDVTGLELKVTVCTKSEFNSYIYNNPKLLNYYSIVVLGMSDSYGNDDDLSDEAIHAIDHYIESGNSVLFTHDSMSYKYGVNGDIVAGNQDNLNDFTKMFKEKIGMQDGYALTDSLIQKLSGKQIYNDVNSKTSTINTNTVKKLNVGQINSYPYSLDDDQMNVATTHGQYFKLDLEHQSDNKDVIVWYTLGAEDNSNDVNKYYNKTGQDALNNYYIYSKGNVTYTSAGHTRLDSSHQDELELFVNTFIRAIMSGNSTPEVEFNDATKENDNLYSLIIRERLSASVNKLPFSYTVTDADLVSKKGYLKEAFLFYDQNDNDIYDEDDDDVIDDKHDVILGYLDSSGNIISTAENSSTARSVISDYTYSCDLIEMLNTAVDKQIIPSGLKATIINKLINNQLRIGIVAKDSHDATGFAVQKIIQRELFNLE